MTRVILSPSILAYRQSMAELVDQACNEKMIVDQDRQRPEELREVRTEVPELWVPGLLGSPKIESLWPDLFLRDGRLDGIIQINTSDEYGIMNIYVILEDERGSLIESDYAMENEVWEDHWGYIASAPVDPGTTIVVRAIAMDGLGGVGIRSEHVTV